MDGGSALSSVVRTLLALVGVCALAWVVLALVARRGGLAARLAGGLASRAPARVRVLERVALSPRRQLYLVQADARVFLLGASEAGPLALLTELEETPHAKELEEAPRGKELEETPHAKSLEETPASSGLAEPGPPPPASGDARAAG